MEHLKRNSDILDEVIQNNDNQSFCLNEEDNDTLKVSSHREFVNPVPASFDEDKSAEGPTVLDTGECFEFESASNACSNNLNSLSSDSSRPEKVQYYDSQPIVFVSKKASRFGIGSSSSDDHLLLAENGSHDDDDDSVVIEQDGQSPNIQPQIDSTQSNGATNDISDNQTLHLSNDIEEDAEKKCLLLKEEISPVIESEPEPEIQNISNVKKSEKSPLLQLKRPIKTSTAKSRTLKLSGKESAKNPILIKSQLKSEESSDEDDSMPINDSETTDQYFSQSNQSEETQAVCSKYSQLSEDGSFPSSPLKSPGSENGNETAKIVFEHPLDLGVAFSEYVDIERFQTSLGKRAPQTEEGYGGKSEEHLLALLKGSSLKNLKRYLRKSHLPPESNARNKLWENLCVHLLKAGGSLYNSISEEIYQGLGEEDHPLPSFVDQHYLYHYHLTPLGRKTVKTIMDVIHSLSPEIIMCPLLYPVASLFLHYMDAENCCNCMQALLRSSSPLFFSQTKISAEASKFVLRDLAKKYTKKAYDFVSKSSNNVENVYEDWRVWIFKDVPFQFLVCIMDSYLLEGHKVLYRLTLAIVLLFAKDMTKKGQQSVPVADVSASISRFCSSLPVGSKKLIKEAFSIKRFTRREIHRLQQYYEGQLRLQTESAPTLPHVASSTSMGQSDTLSGPSHTLSGPAFVDRADNSVLTSDMAKKIWGWIPHRLTLKRLTQLYTTETHGFNLTTMYSRCEMYEPSLMIIKSSKDEVFGAYCTSAWYYRHEVNKPTMAFFGKGETFVFSLSPRVRRYQWVALTGGDQNATDLFQAGDENMLIIGSGNGEAICLDREFDRCRSVHCDTFGNEPLCEDKEFSCKILEIYGFID